MIKTLFCDNWKFSQNPLGTEYADNLSWQPVDLPHDWLIYDVHNLYESATGWYRRKFYHKSSEKQYRLRFDGVYMNTSVYVNGTLAGAWKYGYTTFEINLTELLQDGENWITVRVDYESPNSRWYSGAGIYRNVWLKASAPCHIVSDGIYISASVDGKVLVTTETERPAKTMARELTIRNTISLNGKTITTTENACNAYDNTAVPKCILRDDCKYGINTNTLFVEQPQLWELDHPTLYTCVTELIQNGEVVDCEKTMFGFREIRFTVEHGFFLNRKHVKLHGCCEHHDLGALGAAVNKTAIRRKLEILHTIGINAIRTSHNPPAPEFMQLADEMGFLILSEGFDMWELSKTEHDYAQFFPAWIEKDVAAWIRRDRNHPSLIGWSIGNEIYDTHVSERGQEVTSKLMILVKQHDPRGNGYITLGSNYMASENAQNCADILKLIGYNYAERLYKEHHEKHPDWMIYGSETSSVVQSRGIYHFPMSQPVLCEDDEQCSALGGIAPAWAAKTTEECILTDRDTPFCAGQFIWTGFDYIGEPTPYFTKNSYFGQFDTAGFAKDSAYLFRSAWTDESTAPFVHIYPYWDFQKGCPIDIRVASNASHVELYYNNTLLAAEDFNRSTCQKITLDTQIPYAPGTLFAIAKDKDGNEIAKDVVQSFGNAAELRLLPDKTSLLANGKDLIFLEIQAVDANGIYCANANNRVKVSVSGAGRLIGLDNGDSTDYDQYKGTSRRLFSGKLLAIIAAKTTAGEIFVKVTSPDIPEVHTTLTAAAADIEKGISATEENTPMTTECANPEMDIPIRKIEMLSDTTVFTPEQKEIRFTIRTYPENSTYKNDVQFRLTTVTGIPTNCAEIVDFSDETLTIRAKGGGVFYLHALCKNGTEKFHILAAIPLEAKELGAAVVNPYDFVTGGRYTISSENITNGLERGASIVPGGGYFGFDHVDFGKLGSDKLSLPIYMLSGSPIHFQIYDGIPNQGGTLIGDYTHCKPSQWLTYNEPYSFSLMKKLTGIHTICFASKDSFEIKGFVFESPQKETAEIPAAACESVYGDKFTKTEMAIVDIGNNVVIDFGAFDFSKHLPQKIYLTGRSNLPINSIHLTMTAPDGTQQKNLLEFAGSADYVEREFLLPTNLQPEKKKVTLTFLPGTAFDLKFIRFD